MDSRLRGNDEALVKMKKLGSDTLVIATHNAGKLKEISSLLAPYGLNCISAG